MFFHARLAADPASHATLRKLWCIAPDDASRIERARDRANARLAYDTNKPKWSALYYMYLRYDHLLSK